MWRYRVPTFRHRRELDTADDAESISIAKFADADEDALPLDRPHAPNCVDLRKFLKNRSANKRFANLSSSNDEDSSSRTSSRAEDYEKGAGRSRALTKLLNGLGKPNSCMLHPEDVCDCGVGDGTAESEDFRFREEQGGFEIQVKDDDKRNGLVHRKTSISRTPSVNYGDDVVPTTFPIPKTSRASKNKSNASHKQHDVTDARVTDNVFVRGFNFVRLMFATLYRFVVNSLRVPFHLLKVDRKQIPNVKEKSHDCRLSVTSANIEKHVRFEKPSDKKRSDKELLFDLPKSVQSEHVLELEGSNSGERRMDEAHFDMAKSIDVGNILNCKESHPCERHLGEARFGMATIVDVGNALDRKDSNSKPGERYSVVTNIAEKGKNMDQKESKSPAGSETAVPAKVADTGMDSEERTNHSVQTSSKTEPYDARDAKQMNFENEDGYTREKEAERSHATKQELAIPLNTSKLNRETSCVGTSAEEEEGDAWLWHKIEESEKWMDESERLCHQGTPVKSVESVESPLRFETPRQLQCGTRHIRIDSLNEYSIYSPEPEARKMVEKKSFVVGVMNENEPHMVDDKEILLGEQKPIRRKASRKSSQPPVRVIELHHRISMEEGTRVPKAPRMTSRTSSANFEARPLLSEEDCDLSNQRPQKFNQDQYMSAPPITPVGGPGEPTRKASIRSGIKNDVKAVTESVKRVLLRNKPEPDTRFTSPRSAQKTLTIIADVMVKDLACMVAVRRTGAFKIRSEKIYSSEARLRITLKFRALDAFSCNVIICRSRDDDFTVPTADYVNFVAGLQQRFLNSVTGAWRYQ